jgi:hypothetical protein
MQVYADYRFFLLRGYWQSGLINRVYYKLLKLLPSALERRLYTMVTSRMLRRFRHSEKQ